MKRLLLLATVSISLLGAGSADASVHLSAPEAVVVPRTVPFSTSASASTARVTFLVDGRRRWSDAAGGGAFRRAGRLHLGAGVHTLEVRAVERDGRVATTSQATRVLPTTSRLHRHGSPSPSPSPAPAPEPKPTPAPEPTPTPAPAPTPEPAPAPAPETAPTPAPEQAPEATPTPGALFDGAKIGDFWINHSAPGAVSEVADPTGSGQQVIKMTVSDKDVYPITPTENPRAELLSPGIIKPGDEFWLSTKFLIPQDYPAVPADGWVSLVSVYGAPFNGPSPWRLEVCGNSLQWQRNETYGYDVPFQTPLEKGRWISVLTHERFATNGFVEMWINGEPIKFFSSGGYNPHHIAATERLTMATMDASNDADVNSAKIMQYRKLGMFNSGTIYFGPLRLGTTRASVEG